VCMPHMGPPETPVLRRVPASRAIISADVLQTDLYRGFEIMTVSLPLRAEVL